MWYVKWNFYHSKFGLLNPIWKMYHLWLHCYLYKLLHVYVISITYLANGSLRFQVICMYPITFCLPQTYGVFLVIDKMCIFKPYQCSVFFFLFTVNESKYRACYLNGIPLRKLPFGMCTLKKEKPYMLNTK